MCGALNPTELCFLVRCAGLRLEIVILILGWYETRNSCVKISLPCEASDGFKCDRFEVTEAIITWDVWGQLYSSDVCNHWCLRLCVVGEMLRHTPADQYRSGDLKVTFSLYVNFLCLEDGGRKSLVHVSTYQRTRAVRKNFHPF